MAAKLSVETNRITIESISEGSVVVRFTIGPDSGNQPISIAKIGSVFAGPTYLASLAAWTMGRIAIISMSGGGSLSFWADAGHWVAYDVENSLVNEPVLNNNYPNAAGVNLTLNYDFVMLQQKYVTLDGFELAFALEMADLLRITVSRVKVVHVVDESTTVQSGLTGIPKAYTRVEFIVMDCDDPLQRASGDRSVTTDCLASDTWVGERDPTQAVDTLIEYYYTRNSVLYKYANKLDLLGTVDKTVGIAVIATCGQDPCLPKMQGFLPWVVSGTFIFALATVGCVVLMYGRGALAWIANL